MTAAHRGGSGDGAVRRGSVEHAAGSAGEPGSAPTALFVSPHLDDVAFSCGGTMALFAERGWRTVLATIFTRSVPRPTGFALRCQLDKGLPPDADYMALRREEDRAFAARIGAGAIAHLDLLEAPHRGYDSTDALFSGPFDGDDVWRRVADRLAELLETWAPERVFVPQALGAHADHLQVVRAVSSLRGLAERSIWYRDAPYAARDPLARPSPLLPDDLGEMAVDITSALETKLHACAAYATQIGFQFGGEKAMRETLTGFAAAEARRFDLSGTVVEASLVSAGTDNPEGLAEIASPGLPR